MANQLKTLLSNVLKNQNNPKIKLITNWNQIIGQLKGHVSLEKILKNGTIILGVESSSWMHELNMFSNVLIKNINKHLEDQIVKKIRFKLISKEKNIKIKNYKKNTKIKNKINLNLNLNIRQEKALEKIKDPELTFQLKNYLEKCQNYD